MPRFLVLIPTHEHGELLARSVASLRAQRERDWELVIVGDGPTAETRAAAEAEAARDPRIRYREFPKSGRTGEPSRHVVLCEADAEFVAYLSDDDLWRCDHLERMAEALAEADLATAAVAWIAADGSASLLGTSQERPDQRAVWLSGRNFVPLAAAAHRLAPYRSLAHGWEATPPGTPTDLHMWRAWAAMPGVRFAASPHFTLFKFPSQERRGWSEAERRAELDRWLAVASDPATATELAWFERIACAAAQQHRLELESERSARQQVTRRLREWQDLGPRAHARWALRKLWRRLARRAPSAGGSRDRKGDRPR